MESPRGDAISASRSAEKSLEKLDVKRVLLGDRPGSDALTGARIQKTSMNSGMMKNMGDSVVVPCCSQKFLLWKICNLLCWFTSGYLLFEVDPTISIILGYKSEMSPGQAEGLL